MQDEVAILPAGEEIMKAFVGISLSESEPGRPCTEKQAQCKQEVEGLAPLPKTETSQHPNNPLKF